MGDAIRILVTLVMIAMILIIVARKYYTATAFLGIGFVVLLVTTLITGQSAIAEGGSGNAVVDVFEVMANAITTSLGSTGLVIMVVMGYVGYMTHVKAAELFSIVVARPLRKIKHSEILIFATFVLVVIVKLAIPSSSSEVSLLIATVFPVLIAVGISKETSASLLMVATAIVWGPSNTLALTAFNGAGLENISIPVYFVTKEILPVICMIVVGTIVFILVNKYFDKKEGVLVSRSELPELKDVKELGIPKFYAVFPVLPVLLVIVFSPIVQQYITISVVAANFMSFLLVMIIEIIRKRNIRRTFEDSKALFEGMGKAFVSVVSILIGINVFSAALNQVGGLKILAGAFAGAGGGTITIAVIGAIAAFILIGIGSSISGTLPLFSSLYAAFAASEGELVNMVRILIFGGSLASAVNPIAPTTMIVSGGCNVPITTIIKRTIIPALACLLTEIIVCILIP